MILPGSDRHVAELHFLTFALQADITVFLLVPSGVLINAVDVDVDLSVFHIDVGLVPFAGRLSRSERSFLPPGNQDGVHPACPWYCIRSEPPRRTKSPALPSIRLHSIPFGNGFFGSAISRKIPLFAFWSPFGQRHSTCSL